MQHVFIDASVASVEAGPGKSDGSITLARDLDLRSYLSSIELLERS